MRSWIGNGRPGRAAYRCGTMTSVAQHGVCRGYRSQSFWAATAATHSCPRAAAFSHGPGRCGWTRTGLLSVTRHTHQPCRDRQRSHAAGRVQPARRECPSRLARCKRRGNAPSLQIAGTGRAEPSVKWWRWGDRNTSDFFVTAPRSLGSEKAPNYYFPRRIWAGKDMTGAVWRLNPTGGSRQAAAHWI